MATAITKPAVRRGAHKKTRRSRTCDAARIQAEMRDRRRRGRIALAPPPSRPRLSARQQQPHHQPNRGADADAMPGVFLHLVIRGAHRLPGFQIVGVGRLAHPRFNNIQGLLRTGLQLDILLIGLSPE